MTQKELQNPLKCEENQITCFPRNVKAGQGVVVQWQLSVGAKSHLFIYLFI